MRKNNSIIALVSGLILLTGCGGTESPVSDSFSADLSSENDSAEVNTQVLPPITDVVGEEITQFILPYVAAYNYETHEMYKIYSDTYSRDGDFVREAISFQGQELNIYGDSVSYYNLVKNSGGYNAELSNIYFMLGGEGHLRFKGIAFYEDFYWVLRPLYEEGDDILPLFGKFTGENLAEIEEMTSITVDGKEYKTHPFDIIYLSLEKEYTKENMPDFNADTSRAYLVEGEAERIELSIGHSCFWHTAPNLVLSAEDIGENPFSGKET